jgi:hypothetical protein
MLLILELVLILADQDRGEAGSAVKIKPSAWRGEHQTTNDRREVFRAKAQASIKDMVLGAATINSSYVTEQRSYYLLENCIKCHPDHIQQISSFCGHNALDVLS